MPRIRFTSNPKLPDDLKHLGYQKGTEVDLPQDQCDRWVRRNVAEYVTGVLVDNEAGPRTNGPTIKEWVDAGYKAADYPPNGYEAKSSPEEIERAVAAEAAAGNAPKPVEQPAPSLQQPEPQPGLTQPEPLPDLSQPAAEPTDRGSRRGRKA